MRRADVKHDEQRGLQAEGKAATIPLRASTPPREAPMTTMSRGDPVRLTGRPSRLPGSMLTIQVLLRRRFMRGAGPALIQVRTRLAAGASEIRTLGPSLPEMEILERSKGRSQRPTFLRDRRFESPSLHLRVSLSSHFCAIAGTARAAPAGSKPANNLQARIEGTLFKLAQIAPAHFRLVGEIVLRKPLLMAQAAQVGSEHVSQVHARSGATRSKYAPRYIEQNDWLCDGLRGCSAAPRMN